MLTIKYDTNNISLEFLLFLYELFYDCSLYKFKTNLRLTLMKFHFLKYLIQ